MKPVITGHVFRTYAGWTTGSTGTGGGIARGQCGWLGTCRRPQGDHITVPDYRAARRAAS